MTRLLPRTLFGQMILILLGGLLVSHLIGTWIYASDRAEAVRSVGGYAATQRIANLARLIDEAQPDWRSRIVAAAGDPTLQVALSPVPPALADAPDDGDSVPVRAYLAAQLPANLAEHLRVAVTGAGSPLPDFARYGPMTGMGAGPRGGLGMGAGPRGGLGMGAGPRSGLGMGAGPRSGLGMGRQGGWRALDAAVQLSDGQWLSFSVGLPPGGPLATWQFLVSMAVMAVIVVLASAWAVRRVTAPLGVIAAAAERLGRNVNAPPVGEAGSREMRQAAHAFNEMQGRLQRLLENRTRMLAALSHDLRTPLTLLRLRTEGLQEGEERDRMLASIGDLNAMIGAVLKFARDEAAIEARRRTDLSALVASIVDDMADAGLPVTMEPTEPVILECQSGGLRRAVTNLLDNAMKYGKSARVALLTSPVAIKIVIDDDGPGIPDDELQRVFEPFYRLEQSRSRETGGTGLGLAIVQSIVQAHGGQVTLTNRSGGGLRAIVSLPG
jgi:signal transduction histidine kinase